MLHKMQSLSPEEAALPNGEAMQSILSGICPDISHDMTRFDTNTKSCFESTRQSGYCDPIHPEDCMFFDIETTGLSYDTSFIFLVGCICFENGSWNLHQFFINLVQEEKEMLSAFMKLASHYRVLVHFNGNRFDLPFVRGRAVSNHLEAVLDRCISIDLYQHFRPLRKKLQLPHMNQSFLEKQVGWMRDDTLSGKDIVTLFWVYVSTRQPETEMLLLKHNHDDLAGMLHVLALEGYMSLFAGHILPNAYAAVEESGEHAFWTVCFMLPLPLPAPLELSVPSAEGSQYFLSANTDNGKLRVPFYTGTLRHFISDYKNYYYLPVENQIVHKSVAAYVAKDYREKAKQENCFVSKESRFLPLPKCLPENDADRKQLAQPPFTPVFQENLNSKNQYFEYKADMSMTTDDVLLYTKYLLRHIS